MVSGPMLESLESKLQILPNFQLSVNFVALRPQVSVTKLVIVLVAVNIFSNPSQLE